MMIAADSRLSPTDSYTDDCYGFLVLEAEAELGAFRTAIHEMFGEPLVRIAMNLWMEELERTDRGQNPCFRRITIAAASRLAAALGVPCAAPATTPSD